MDSKFWKTFPRIYLNLLYLRLRRFQSICNPTSIKYLNAIASSDMVVSTGGGLINDSFPSITRNLLTTFEIAQQLGKRTALFGQGVGPLEDSSLANEALHIIEKLDVMAIRENFISRPILENLGLKPELIITTGDDAIELAYNARKTASGSCLGVNLRVASYSGVDEREMLIFRAAITRASKILNAPLIPLPIAFSEGESDISSLKKLFPHEFSSDQLVCKTPLDLIANVSECKVVVTGSYHSGVFALSQGIPVIGVYLSPYYRGKLVGLAQQFGVGCEIIDLSGIDAEDELVNVIVDTWNTSEKFKSELLVQAERQIKLSHAAYERLN